MKNVKLDWIRKNKILKDEQKMSCKIMKINEIKYKSRILIQRNKEDNVY